MIKETQQERLICTKHQGKTVTIPVQKTFKEYRTKIKNEFNFISNTIVYFENDKKEKIEIQTPKDYQKFLANNPNLSPIQATIELPSKVENNLTQYYESHKNNSKVEVEADSVPIIIDNTKLNKEIVQYIPDINEVINEKPAAQGKSSMIRDEKEIETTEEIEGTDSKLILLPPQRVGIRNPKNLKVK